MQDSAGRTGGVEEALLLACNGEGWDVMEFLELEAGIPSTDEDKVVLDVPGYLLPSFASSQSCLWIDAYPGT
eukprot:3055743-Rhodomonas_salina.2